MTDKKEWVTIKIPETVRDDAKSDERTYGEIMEAGLEVPSDDLKQYEEFVETVESAIQDADVDIEAGRIVEELEALKGLLNSTSVSPVTLEATEYSKIADEVEERLR